MSGAFLTHTHKRRGGREGGKERGQPARTNNGKTRENNKGRKQAGEHTTSRQNKGKEWGKAVKGSTKEAHRNPTLARRRAISAKQNRKQKLKQDSTGQEQRHT